MNNLTRRELQITELRTHGLLPIQIGDKLTISENTVNNHLASIFKKVEVNNVVSLTRWYIYNIELSRIVRTVVAVFFAVQFSLWHDVDMRRSRRRSLRRSSRRRYAVISKCITLGSLCSGGYSNQIINNK